MRRTLMLVAFAVAFSAYGEDVKECLQTCKEISKPCFEPCKKLNQSSTKARCRQQCDLISSTCKDSCEKKRRIDPEYMEAELLKRMPKGGSAEGGNGKTITVEDDHSGSTSP